MVDEADKLLDQKYQEWLPTLLETVRSESLGGRGSGMSSGGNRQGLSTSSLAECIHQQCVSGLLLELLTPIKHSVEKVGPHILRTCTGEILVPLSPAPPTVPATAAPPTTAEATLLGHHDTEPGAPDGTSVAPTVAHHHGNSRGDRDSAGRSKICPTI